MTAGFSFVHIGDIHKQPGPRSADVLRALDQIVDECLGLLTIAGWLIPGDLFHMRSTPEDRNTVADRVMRMASVAPVVICDGNHDGPGDLQIFARLRGTWPIYVVSTPDVIEVPLPRGEVASVFVLPYPTKAGLVAAGVAPDDVVDVAADPLEAIFRQAAAALEDKARVMGHIPLMIGHVNVGGSIVSSGQPNIGREIEISARHLDLLGPIYKGLNHIHVAQEIAGAHYAGSICRLNWGEVEPKSYTVIHYESVDDTLVIPEWRHTVSRRPIAVPPMYHVSGVLSTAGFRWEILGDTVAHDGAALDWTGSDVRVRYTFGASERNVLNHELVRTAFPGARTLLVEPVAEPDRELRAPAVAAARTIGEKFMAYCAASGIATTETLEAKRARLETQDPTALLSAVQTALAHIEAGEKAAEVAA